MNLLDKLPVNKRTEIEALIEEQRNGEYSPQHSARINKIGKEYGFRWCKKSMHVEHLNKFGTKEGGGAQPYCKPCHVDYSATHDNADTGETRDEYGEGGIAGDQVITDNLRDNINKKKKNKKSLWQRFLDLFKKPVLIQNKEEQGAAYREMSQLIRKGKSRSSRATDLKEALKRVDSLGHLVYACNTNGFVKMKTFERAVEYALPGHNYEHSDYACMIYRSLEEYVKYNGDSKIEQKYLKILVGKIKHQQNLPQYD